MKRLVTALVLIPVITYLIIWAPFIAFAIVLAIISTLCYIEFAGIAAAHSIEKPGVFGIAAGMLVLFVPDGGISLMAGIGLAAIALALRSQDLTKELPRAAALLLGIVYIYGSWRCSVLLRSISPYWLFFAIALNWVGDSAALYAGKAFGRHKLSPRISPGKTWEGAFASVLGSVAFGLIYARFALPAAPLLFVVASAALANAAGQIGDLCESAFKRGAGMKDSGTLLPGHGGWLDRVDSTLFAVPAVYGLVVLARFGAVPGL
jgi:phosphatidate cytidylyltransferase